MPADLTWADQTTVSISTVLSLVFYGDEKLKAWEVGLKSAFLDGRAQLTGALYYYDYEDYQIT